jgi:hypothetical protein
MFLVRVLIFASLFGLPCAAEWTTAQREWALGTSAVLTKVNAQRYDLLVGTDEPVKLVHVKSILENTWGIHSREDLLESIHDLLQDPGTRNGIAWNYPRVVSLARWGYAMGYISEAEAWAVIMPTAQRLQRAFFSWQELGRAYLDARQHFYGDELAIRRENEWVYRAILLDPTSPWRKYAWDLDLGGDPVTARPGKSAELTLAVHPQGLMCVRLRIPDHLDAEDHAYEPYLKAIENAVGCKPRIKGSSYDSKDWILDTECSNEEVLQGTQVVARLSIEPIAAQLRREGVTEMFTYVQHEPLGTSLLVPAAQDTYVDNELRWYLSTMPLSNPLPDLMLTYGFVPEKTLPGPDRVRVARLPGNLNPTIPWRQSIRPLEPRLSP